MLSLLTLAIILIIGTAAATVAKTARIIGPKDDSANSLPLGDRDVALKALNYGFTEHTIDAKDGIKIRSIVYDPKPVSSNGKNPLLIFISSWGMNKWEYVVPAYDYAKEGYTVISYTSRGFWGSGGEIDLAGNLDMSDISTVIDWALENTNADVDRIGLSGISYGGGISILATAFDTRVKSAVSMSCWVDLAQSFLGNGETVRTEAVQLLDLLAKLTGTTSNMLETMFSDYFANIDLQYLYDNVYNSSAVNFIDKINANKPAIFIANALGDSLFTPNQFPSFFNKLDVTNKHLEFAPGDHAGPELPGLLNIPDQIWQRALQWNNYYVKNHNNNDAPLNMPAVVFNVVDSDAVEAYNSWEDVTNGYLKYQLSSNENLQDVSSAMLNSTVGNEVATVKTGENAGINGGVAFITATIRDYINHPLTFNVNFIKRKYAAVFQSKPLDYSVRIRGNPQLTLNFIPKQSTAGTFIVYLLDVDRFTNIGTLISFAPWTFKNVVAGEAQTLNIEITTTSYDLPAKHHLAAVIGTHDKLFLDQSPKNVDISFLSGSLLSIPLHK